MHPPSLTFLRHRHNQNSSSSTTKVPPPTLQYSSTPPPPLLFSSHCHSNSSNATTTEHVSPFSLLPTPSFLSFGHIPSPSAHLSAHLPSPPSQLLFSFSFLFSLVFWPLPSSKKLPRHPQTTNIFDPSTTTMATMKEVWAHSFFYPLSVFYKKLVMLWFTITVFYLSSPYNISLSMKFAQLPLGGRI